MKVKRKYIDKSGKLRVYAYDMKTIYTYTRYKTLHEFPSCIVDPNPTNRILAETSAETTLNTEQIKVIFNKILDKITSYLFTNTRSVLSTKKGYQFSLIRNKGNGAIGVVFAKIGELDRLRRFVKNEKKSKTERTYIGVKHESNNNIG